MRERNALERVMAATVGYQPTSPDSVNVIHIVKLMMRSVISLKFRLRELILKSRYTVTDTVFLRASSLKLEVHYSRLVTKGNTFYGITNNQNTTINISSKNNIKMND